MRRSIDKRHFDRLKTESFSIVYKVDGSSEKYSGEVINISSGGICFLRTGILEKGDVIQIKFPFETRRVVLSGSIIRIDGREVGVKFLDDENEIERFVKTYNEEFSKKKKPLALIDDE